MTFSINFLLTFIENPPTFYTRKPTPYIRK